MRLNLSAEGNSLTNLVCVTQRMRSEPLDNVARLGSEDQKRVVVLTDILALIRDRRRASNMLADLADMERLLAKIAMGGFDSEIHDGLAFGGLSGNMGCYRMAAPVVRATTRASAVVATSVQASRVALVVLGVRALDHLEDKEAMLLIAAGEVPVVPDAVCYTRDSHVAEVVNILNIFLCGEQCVVAVLAST